MRLIIGVTDVLLWDSNKLGNLMNPRIGYQEDKRMEWRCNEGRWVAKQEDECQRMKVAKKVMG
jgi:hypothetical protein